MSRVLKPEAVYFGNRGRRLCQVEDDGLLEAPGRKTCELLGPKARTVIRSADEELQALRPPVLDRAVE